MKELINISNDTSRGKFVLSRVTQMEQKNHGDSPSVKMVLSGTEHYTVNDRPYSLNLNQFLVVDYNNQIELNIHSKKAVHGICIFPSKCLIQEVAKAYSTSTESLLDQPFDTGPFNLTHGINYFHANHTGSFLNQMIPNILKTHKRNECIDFQEFYTQLAECLIEDQLELNGKLRHIASVKKATKEELYRRVTMAKDFIEDNYREIINLDDLAMKATLSKYHFMRTFKALFHISPYQYLQKYRLLKAKELLSKDYSYSETSSLIGFSDEKNLRKALKKFQSI